MDVSLNVVGAAAVAAAACLAGFSAIAAAAPTASPCTSKAQWVGWTGSRSVANLEEGIKRGINDDLFAMRTYFRRAVQPLVTEVCRVLCNSGNFGTDYWSACVPTSPVGRL
jgi:hypothetical protein